MSNHYSLDFLLGQIEIGEGVKEEQKNGVYESDDLVKRSPRYAMCLIFDRYGYHSPEFKLAQEANERYQKSDIKKRRDWEDAERKREQQERLQRGGWL